MFLNYFPTEVLRYLIKTIRVVTIKCIVCQINHKLYVKKLNYIFINHEMRSSFEDILHPCYSINIYFDVLIICIVTQ